MAFRIHIAVQLKSLRKKCTFLRHAAFLIGRRTDNGWQLAAGPPASPLTGAILRAVSTCHRETAAMLWRQVQLHVIGRGRRHRRCTRRGRHLARLHKVDRFQATERRQLRFKGVPCRAARHEVEHAGSARRQRSERRLQAHRRAARGEQADVGRAAALVEVVLRHRTTPAVSSGRRHRRAMAQARRRHGVGRPGRMQAVLLRRRRLAAQATLVCVWLMVVVVVVAVVALRLVVMRSEVRVVVMVVLAVVVMVAVVRPAATATGGGGRGGGDVEADCHGVRAGGAGWGDGHALHLSRQLLRPGVGHATDGVAR